jgi:hypothetical protein
VGVYDYASLRAHLRHKLVCAGYGPDEDDPVNVSVECETCDEVLLDYDAPGWEVDEDDDHPQYAVGARAHSDDQAGDFGGDYAADAVGAESAAWDPECRRLADDLAARPRMAAGDPVGFDCYVDTRQATDWLRAHRPDPARRLEGDDAG